MGDNKVEGGQGHAINVGEALAVAGGGSDRDRDQKSGIASWWDTCFLVHSIILN